MTPGFFGWPEITSPRLYGSPTVADQLNVLQNCVIVDHGRVLQTPQTSNASNIVKSKNKVLNVPSILETMRANINIHSEIEELSIEDNQFNYVLNNILNIVGKQLENTKRKYKIEVKLETDLCNPLDRHSNIIIILEKNNYKYILDIWDEIGHEISKYLESLKGEVMTIGDVDKLYDLINVIFTPGCPETLLSIVESFCNLQNGYKKQILAIKK